METINWDLFEEVMASKPFPLVEGPEEGEDLSHSIILMSEDLQYVEAGIPIGLFKDKWISRPIDSEFQLLRRLTENDDHSLRLKPKNTNITSYNRYQHVLPCKKAF